MKHIYVQVYICVCSAVILKIFNNLNSMLALAVEISEKAPGGKDNLGRGLESGCLPSGMEVFFSVF